MPSTTMDDTDDSLGHKISPFMEYMKIMSDDDSESESGSGGDDDDSKSATESNDDAMEADKKSVPSTMIPLEILPKVLAFCPMSSFLAMRAVNKAYRNKFSINVCQERISKMLKASKTSAAVTTTATTATTTATSKTKSSFSPDWGRSKNHNIEKALEVAKDMFFETREGNDDDDNEPTSVLMADGYDEEEARKLLKSEGVIICQQEDHNGRSGKLWRVEARFKKVSVSNAIREMKCSASYYKNSQDFVERFTYRLLGIPSDHQVSIAEYDVSIRKRPGGRLQGKAMQVFTWFGGESTRTLFFPRTY